MNPSYLSALHAVTSGAVGVAASIRTTLGRIDPYPFGQSLWSWMGAAIGLGSLLIGARVLSRPPTDWQPVSAPPRMPPLRDRIGGDVPRLALLTLAAFAGFFAARSIRDRQPMEGLRSVSFSVLSRMAGSIAFARTEPVATPVVSSLTPSLSSSSNGRAMTRDMRLISRPVLDGIDTNPAHHLGGLVITAATGHPGAFRPVFVSHSNLSLGGSAQGLVERAPGRLSITSDTSLATDVLLPRGVDPAPAIRAIRGAVEGCVHRLDPAMSMDGRLEVELAVARDGSVVARAARAIATPVWLDDVARCVVRSGRVGQVGTPPRAYVSYASFVFSREGALVERAHPPGSGR